MQGTLIVEKHRKFAILVTFRAKKSKLLTEFAETEHGGLKTKWRPVILYPFC